MNTTPPPTREERLDGITTDYIFPPIPDRHFDWVAYRDPESFNGYGRTEKEAIDHLLQQEADNCVCYGCVTMRHPCIKDGDKHG